MTTKSASRPMNNRLPSVADSLKRIDVKIRGLPPGLIFQGKGLMALQADDTKKTKPLPPAEEARLRAHWTTIDGKKQLCIPWVMIYQSICTAAGSYKFRGAKKMTTVVAATVSCETDRISLGSDKFEVFEEFCRIPPRTGSMVNIGRPKIPKWEAEFTMVVDAEQYPAEVLEKILADAGKLVGIGAWRPQLKGPYGRFEVVAFDIR